MAGAHLLRNLGICSGWLQTGGPCALLLLGLCFCRSWIFSWRWRGLSREKRPRRAGGQLGPGLWALGEGPQS